MTLPPRIRKLALTGHVTVSVGWLGALAVFLAHAIASLVSRDEQIVRAASIAMGLTAWFVILPLSFASVITGLIQALGTTWGLFRHYWIVFKLVLTAVATIVLLLKLAPISYLADMAAQPTFSSRDLVGLRTSLLVHAAGGLLVLLAAASLGLYKPAGMTGYGRARVASAASTPRWVKAFGLVVVVLLLIVGGMMLLGGHGPGAHMPAHR
jgi:hypothetical protein